MKKTSLPKPTGAELNILRTLWQIGPGTVRQVTDELNRTQKTGYTTVLKLLQIMVEKGLVERDDADRAHVYKSALTEDETQRQLVSHLLERAFRGSTHRVAMHALEAKKATSQELAQIRKFLDKLEGGQS